MTEESKHNTISQNFNWAINSPICICDTTNKSETVLYICFEESCPSYSKSRLYCQKCMLGKTAYKHRLHDHYLIEDEFDRTS